ncbi:hypothetical protein BJY04DRAFT_213176 [Aspergillus karnatakaensis]|uniref:uncharacterized protein n=1 Tax=Aspergillus karnatakaensis TaxID=1810916 RepID=UPI003CCD1AE7
MATITYRDGIAILQLIVFPFVFITSLFIWKRTGWRVGAKIWRYAATLSLIRIAGSISSLLTISHDSRDVEVAVAVCELIGLAPLLLTYIGILRQIDMDQKMHPRFLNLLALACFIGLILGIAGVSSAGDNEGGYQPGIIVKASMGIFIAVFVITMVLAVWLFIQLSFSMRVFQRRLFLAVVLCSPLLLIRIIYSAISDYAHNSRFAVLSGDPTVYLCMSVLEEIVAMGVTMALGVAAVRAEDFVQVVAAGEGKPEVAYQPCSV